MNLFWHCEYFLRGTIILRSSEARLDVAHSYKSGQITMCLSYFCVATTSVANYISFCNFQKMSVSVWSVKKIPFLPLLKLIFQIKAKLATLSITTLPYAYISTSPQQLYSYSVRRPSVFLLYVPFTVYRAFCYWNAQGGSLFSYRKGRKHRVKRNILNSPLVFLCPLSCL